MTQVNLFKMLPLLMTVSLFFAMPVLAQNEEGGVKKFGVVYNIAEDREVEKVGGVYEPEGLDKYMKRKFDAVEARVAGVESRLDNVETLLKDQSDMLDKILESTKQSQKSQK